MNLVRKLKTFFSKKKKTENLNAFERLKTQNNQSFQNQRKRVSQDPIKNKKPPGINNEQIKKLLEKAKSDNLKFKAKKNNEKRKPQA
jgi:hypothetical protein